MCVMHYDSIVIHADSELIFIGDRSIALVADNDIVIDGTLDIAGHHGEFHAPGSNSYPLQDTDMQGSGGGGNQTEGAPGGTSTVPAGAGNGGPIAPNPATQTSLTGGYSGVGRITNIEGGGSGGGAITLISCSGSIRVSGTGIINASGGGGTGGGMYEQFFRLNGYGGGSGGNVVLQALNVVIDGYVFSNGGGGGAGSVLGGTGPPGADGSLLVNVQAPGGFAVGGGGGAGGCAGMNPSGGDAPISAADGAGGGGGSVGYLQLYVPAGVTPAIAASHTSPEMQYFTLPPTL